MVLKSIDAGSNGNGRTQPTRHCRALRSRAPRCYQCGWRQIKIWRYFKFEVDGWIAPSDVFTDANPRTRGGRVSPARRRRTTIRAELPPSARDVAVANYGGMTWGRRDGRERHLGRKQPDPPTGARLTGSVSTNSVDLPRGILLPQFQVPALRCWCRAPSLSSCRSHVVGSCLRAPSRNRRK
jgi:hypothetical protein